MKITFDELTSKYGMTPEKARSFLAEKATAGPTPSFKVSAKGAVSVYGLGRFPVTLYGSQWAALLGVAEYLKAFIDANANLLAVKE